MLTKELLETMELLLANRLFLYSLFHKAFGREPDEALLDLLCSENTLQGLELLSEEAHDTMQRSADFLKKWKKENPDFSDPDLLSRLRQEYMKLFVGPDKLIAPPWESVYRSKEGLLFQESTMTVREIYRTQGLHPEGYPHVADDGLALELDFLSRMTDRALKLVQSTDTEATVRGSDGTASAPSHANELTDMLRDNLTVQESFLRVHLLFWIPKLLERTNDSPTRLLYPQLTQMLLFFLQKDQEAVVELLGTLQ